MCTPNGGADEVAFFPFLIFPIIAVAIFDGLSAYPQLHLHDSLFRERALSGYRKGRPVHSFFEPYCTPNLE